jgi:hypothetical protein
VGDLSSGFFPRTNNTIWLENHHVDHRLPQILLEYGLWQNTTSHYANQQRIQSDAISFDKMNAYHGITVNVQDHQSTNWNRDIGFFQSATSMRMYKQLDYRCTLQDKQHNNFTGYIVSRIKYYIPNRFWAKLMHIFRRWKLAENYW